MWSLLNLALLALGVSQSLAVPNPSPVGNDESTYAPLKQSLSKAASISFNSSNDPRWSDYHAPVPIAVVNVATEQDVALTVKFCRAAKIPFLPQNGGHGWISSFNLGNRGVIINMHGLNQVTFNSDRTQATIGGGTLISEELDAAFANNVRLTTGNCNCVGALGAILGGGYGNLMGTGSFGVDTLLSLKYVNPNGDLITVTPKDNDLWYALRGAGPNFGIVTSAVAKSTPLAQAQNTAWLGPVIFDDSKIEGVVAAIDKLKLEPEMNIFLYYAVSSGKPLFFVTVFYNGDEATGRKKFRPIFDVGPLADSTSVLTQNHWNDGAAGFCIKGGRKPSYGAGMKHMKPAVWRAVWNEFVKFTSNPGTETSAILMEAYSLDRAQSFPESSSAFPFRHVPFNAIAIPSYTDKSFDPVAEAFGSKVRDIWWANSDISSNVTYINFAHGDETLLQVYGDSLPKLQALKKKYDPNNVFNQWFPLIPRK